MNEGMIEKIVSIGIITSLLLAAFSLVGPTEGASPLTVISIGSGVDPGDRFGHFVEHIPDITGDGLSELMTGAPYNSSGGASAGSIYIFFSPLKGRNIDAGNANVNITGTFVGQNFGYSGAYLPDVFTGNAGGEIAIGCPGNDSDNGSVYIFELSALSGGGTFTSDAAEYFVLGEDQEKFGFSVSMAGDIDDDNIPDLLVGAPNGTATNFNVTGSRSGRAYVIYGKADPVPGNSSLADVTITGWEDLAMFGFSVSMAGKVNAGNVDDIIIGAPGNGSSGMAYIYLGNPGGLAPNRTSRDANVNITEGTAGLELGYSVNCTGDFNGDGADDVVIGGPGFNGGRGAAYVVFGSKQNVFNDVDLSAPNVGYLGIVGLEAGRLGHSVTGLTDMDNDGYDDCLIGAPLYNDTRGFAYTFFGNASFSTQFISTANANATNKGNTAGEMFGSWVSEGGNVDGDIYPDTFAGAPNATNKKGKVYVLKLDHLPTLSVPEPVSPVRGNATTSFTYKVIYTDIENDPPAAQYPRVRIYKKIDGTDLNTTPPDTMLLDTNADNYLQDGDYTNGEQYYFTTILGIEHNYNYQFECLAANNIIDLVNTTLQANESTGSKPVVDTTAPNSILNLEVMDTPADHGGSIYLNWTRLINDDFHSYQVYIDDQKFNSVLNKTPHLTIQDINETDCTITSYEGVALEDYKEYWVGVGATDDMGNRIISIASVSVVPRDNYNLLPGNISDLGAAGGPKEGEVLLNWTAVGEDMMTNGPVSEYIVKYSTNRNFFSTSDWNAGTLLNLNLTPKAPGQRMEVTVGELLMGTQYFFALKGVDSVGQMSNLSNSAETFPSDAPDLTAPNPVYGVTIFDIKDDNTSLGVLWMPDDSIDFHHYNIYISDKSFSNVTEEGVYLEDSNITSKSTDQTQISTMNGLPLIFGKSYSVAITAVDESGNENISVICSYSLLFKDDFDVTPPNSIESVLAWDTDDDEGGSISISWDICEATDFLVYSLYISKDPISSVISPVTKLTRQSYERDNLSAVVAKYGEEPLINGVKYYLAVVARDFNGQVSTLGPSSVFGPVEPVNDSDRETPPGVKGFKVKTKGTNEITLEWIPLTRENVPDFHQYIIFYSTPLPIDLTTAERTDGATNKKLLVLETSSVTITGLEKEINYYFVLLCQDDRMGKTKVLEGNVSSEINVFLTMLDNGKVTPASGNADDVFTFQISFSHTDPPNQKITMIIDNESFYMIYEMGGNITGATYMYETALSEGEHSYYFTYESGGGAGKIRYPKQGYLKLSVAARTGGPGGGGGPGIEDEGMSTMAIIIIIVILLLSVVGAVMILLVMKKKKAIGDRTESAEQEKSTIEMWTCTCGDVSIPVTESAHCGFCGEYHEPIPEGDEISTASNTKYPDYTAENLYGDMPTVGSPSEFSPEKDNSIDSNSTYENGQSQHDREDVATGRTDEESPVVAVGTDRSEMATTLLAAEPQVSGVQVDSTEAAQDMDDLFSLGANESVQQPIPQPVQQPVQQLAQQPAQQSFDTETQETTIDDSSSTNDQVNPPVEDGKDNPNKSTSDLDEMVDGLLDDL